MKVVVFVDVQKDFVKGGALPYGYPETNYIEKNLIAFAEWCRENGYQMFATVDTHEPTVYDTYEAGAEKHPISGYLASIEGKYLPIEHCIENTEGHKIMDGIAVDANGIINIPRGHIVGKGTFGATALPRRITRCMEMLDEPIEEILICGFCTSICVVSNALLLKAVFPETPIYLIDDLCGDIDADSHYAAVKVLHNCQIPHKYHSDVCGHCLLPPPEM